MRKMMLCTIAIAIIGFAGLLPFNGTDVGKLHPVEVLVLSDDGETVVLETDTGLRGTGNTMEQAIENLRRTSAGEIFLDTVNYALVTKGSEYLIDMLYDYLRPACQIFVFTGDAQWDEIAKYLESHPSKVTILGYRQGMRRIPELVVKGEDYKIEKS